MSILRNNLKTIISKCKLETLKNDIKPMLHFINYENNSHVNYCSNRIVDKCFALQRFYSNTSSKGSAIITESVASSEILDLITYESVASDTLESLCDYFDILVEQSPHLKAADVSYSDGVLTIKLGNSYGTYVINRQTPNRQIWLSSPTSGPKRYDFVAISNNQELNGYWIYKHEKITLHELLQKEIKAIVKKDVDFLSLPFGNKI